MEQNDRLVLFGFSNGIKTAHWIDPRRGSIEKTLMWNQEDKIIYKATFERFHHIKDVYLPLTIRIERPLLEEKLTLFYDQIDVNKTINPNKFRLKIPDNAIRLLL